MIFFVKKSILKSLIIIVGQCEGIFCVMFSRIELKCDTYNLGGLYIAIMYNASCVLLLKNAMINFAPEFVMCFLSMTHYHHKVP